MASELHGSLEQHDEVARRVRPRRSVLYVPGSHERALSKARTLPADALILDLEDAVSPDAKDAARQKVSATLVEGGFGPRELIVRINALDTPWGREDLATMAVSRADALLLPKVESPDDVERVISLFEDLEVRDDLELWCMMETPRGVLRAHEIARSSPRLGAFVMGTSDLTKDLHAVHTRTRLPLLTSLGLCLLAARSERLAILDGVHLDLADGDAFEEACRQGSELGFDGKTLIHPSQIAPANAAFAPTAADVERARRIIDAHAEAEAEGRGVVLLEGKLVEALHVEEAHRCLGLAMAIDERERMESRASTD